MGQFEQKKCLGVWEGMEYANIKKDVYILFFQLQSPTKG